MQEIIYKLGLSTKFKECLEMLLSLTWHLDWKKKNFTVTNSHCPPPLWTMYQQLNCHQDKYFSTLVFWGFYCVRLTQIGQKSEPICTLHQTTADWTKNQPTYKGEPASKTSLFNLFIFTWSTTCHPQP